MSIGKRIEEFNADLDKKLAGSLANAILEGNTRQVQNIIASNILPQQQAQNTLQQTQQLASAQATPQAGIFGKMATQEEVDAANANLKPGEYEVDASEIYPYGYAEQDATLNI